MKNMKAYGRKAIKSSAAAAGGAAAGFINGFLGSGGGIILLYLFGKLSRTDGANSPRDNFASTVAAVLPLSAVSAVIYSDRGMGDISILLRLALPAAAGGVLGALLTDRLNTDLLKEIFAVIVTVAGVNMLL